MQELVGVFQLDFDHISMSSGSPEAKAAEILDRQRVHDGDCRL
jgi:hypothetical protein